MFHSMKQTKLFFKPGQAARVLGAALLLALAGCAGHVVLPGDEIAAASPAIVAQNDHVYYPN